MPVDKDDEVLWELRKKLQFFHRNCPADNFVEGLADLEKCTCGIDEQLKDATQLIHAREEQWHSPKVSMPNEGEYVLARLEWPSGKEVYAVLQHQVIEDNEPWLYDGDELSFSVNVTHWRRFSPLQSQLKENKEE